jgi:hypothetical protein
MNLNPKATQIVKDEIKKNQYKKKKNFPNPRLGS